jgi:hypothetical protein
MKMILSSLLFLMSFALGQLYADSPEVSDQGGIDLSKWKGRAAAYASEPTVAVTTDDQSQTPGQPYLTVKTSGSLGSGLRLNPSISVKTGSPYLVSFWIKTSSMAEITFRITDISEQRSNDAIDTWHSTPNSVNTWAKVEYLFFPISSMAGLEIAQGQNQPGTQLSISDPKIMSVGVDASSDFSLDFSSLTAVWRGRSALGGVPPLTKMTERGAPESGKSYLTIQTDGKLGCGFTLDPIVHVAPDKTYVISFWVKTSAPIPLSFRISGAKGREYGEENGTWHTATSSIDSWVNDKYQFTPACAYIGLEIGAGATHVPCQFSIADVTVAPRP